MSGPRKLVVEIVGARNLMSKDGYGSANAFCTLDYDGNRRKTRTVSKDLSPAWGAEFDFLYGDGEGVLEINVYNERTGGTRRHGFLGRVMIKVPDVVTRGQEALQWLRLDKRGRFSHVKGELGVKVWWEDPKPPQPQPPSSSSSEGTFSFERTRATEEPSPTCEEGASSPESTRASEGGSQSSPCLPWAKFCGKH